MSITFACGHCGKSFTVDDKFGGKQGRCKQCNAVMSIPNPVGVNVFVPASEVEPSRKFQPTSRPAEPIRGFDIEPPTVRNSKRLYDTVYPKESRRSRVSRHDDSAAATIGKVAVGIVVAVLAIIALKTVSPHLFDRVGSKFVSRRELDRLYQERIDDMNSLADSLARVQDIPSAQRESARAEAAVRKLTAGLLHLDKTQGLKADVEAISRLYRIPQANARQRATQESLRIHELDGVWLALGIQAACDEGAAVEARLIPGGNEADFKPGLQAQPALPILPRPGRFNFPDRPNFVPQPPNFTPPNFNPPNFNPPNFNPPPPPNFGPNGPRGGMPTMPPRFNNRRGGRPQAGPPN